MPMQIFTHDELSPRESTLYIIRQIAHSYRAMKGCDEPLPLCLN